MSAREVALLVVRDVFGPAARGAQASFDYRSRKAHLDPRDRAFASELAYGSIKMRRTIDWYLRPYIGPRLKTLPMAIAEILRLGTYQLVWMKGVAARAAVHESVSLALRYGHKGTAGLVNAVLRKLSDAPPQPPANEGDDVDDAIATRYSFPTWMVMRLRQRFPQLDVETLLAAINQPPPLWLRVNLAHSDVAQTREALRALHLDVSTSEIVAEALRVEGEMTAAGLSELADGRWDVQSESSCMPVDILDPQPGETVLDLCSGRAHKTVQIAGRLRGSGNVVAIDADARKTARALSVLERDGISGVAVVTADATHLTDAIPQADAVLLDAPCSASGILGRHPEARWRKLPEDADRLAELQGRLLDEAATRVRPGGRLVYSVCSIEPCENEEAIGRFLSRYPSFTRAALPERYRGLTRDGDVLIAPGADRRDGFYIASLRNGAT